MKRTSALVISALIVILAAAVIISIFWRPTRSASQGPVATPVAAVNPTTTQTPTTAPTGTPTGTPVVNPNPTRVGFGSTIEAPPTAEPTEVPTLANTKVPASKTPAIQEPTEMALICRLDKVNTIDEPADGQPLRIEVGGHGRQHTDYYPHRGVPSISYIVEAIKNPSGTPQIWYGFGSIWEAPLSNECESFDWIEDATAYAKARLDSGHSGLVVDLRSGEPKVVVNVGNLSESEIADLLATHAAGQTLATALACVEAIRDDRDPVVGTPWELNPTGGWVIINGWTNQPGASQEEFKLLLSPEDNPSAFIGGARWTLLASCESAALEGYNSNPLPEITVAELEEMGLLVPNDV